MNTKTDTNAVASSRVLAVPGDYSGCGWYRVIQPARMLQNNGFDITLAPAGQYRGMSEITTLFTQRLKTPQILDGLEMYKKKSGVSVVCDFDDILWMTDSGETVPEYNFCRDRLDVVGTRKALDEKFDKIVDKVSVTTETLKKSVSEFCSEDKIKVIPNRLSWSEWHFELDPRVPQEPVYGFFGSPTHVGVQNKTYGDWSESMVKYFSDKPFISMGFKPWFLNRCQMSIWSPIWKYAQYFREEAVKCTFIIVPLSNNLFNKAKSPLKYLECAAVGRVCLCSSFEGSPYEDLCHPYQKIPEGADEKQLQFIIHRALGAYNDILIHQYKVLNNYWLENAVSDYRSLLEFTS